MDYSVSSLQLPAHELMQIFQIWELWERIPAAYSPDFFVSAGTMQCWLESIPPSTSLVLTMLFAPDGKIAGIALFGRFRAKVAKILPVTTLTLSRSGFGHIDQWWPEYVQPRCFPEHQGQIGWWFCQVAKQQGAVQWETEVVPVSWLSMWQKNSPESVAHLFENQEDGGLVPLQPMMSFRRSVERQCRQTERFAESSLGGPLCLVEVQSSERQSAIQKYLHWHMDKWRGTETPSGFENPVFKAVITRLSSLESGRLRVFLLQASGQVLGMQIVLCSGSWAGFYLASLQPIASNHWRPGIWLHTQIAHALSVEGVSVYDLMAGNADYKKMLSADLPSFGRGVWFDTTSWWGKLVFYLRSKGRSARC